MTRDTNEVRPVSLRQSSWQLVDEAAVLCGGTIDEVLDSLVQGFLATDGGRAVARAESLAAIRQYFGENHG